MKTPSPNRSVKSESPDRTKRPTRPSRRMGLLYLTLALCVLFAWGPPIKRMIERRIRPEPAGDRNAYGFIALVYGDRSPDAHSSFHQHVEALKSNGYVPISLDDAVQLLHRGRPVPQQAILLTVDTTGGNGLRELQSAIRRYRWNAVAFVSTDAGNTPAERRRLRAVNRDRHWEIEPLIPPEAEGEWPVGLSFAGLAMAYPDGDFGQFESQETLQDDILKGAAHDSLAFTRGATGRNTMFCNRLRLNRMEVSPNWTPTELISAIKSANREIETVDDLDRVRRATGWFCDRGAMGMRDNGLTLQPANGSEDARAWLAGSDLRRDFSLSLDFQMDSGTASFYLRHTPDAYLRIMFTPGGDALIEQQSILRESPVVLERTRAPIRPGRSHRMDIHMRNRNINVSVDGIAVFNVQEQTAGLKTSGLFGAEIIRDPGASGTAMLVLDRVSLRPRQSTLASWDPEAAPEDFLIHWMRKHGGRLTEISPPLDRMIQTSGSDGHDLFRHLARMYHLRLIPGIQIESADELETWSPVLTAETVSGLDCDGLFVNFETCRDIGIRDLEQWLRQTGRLLSGSGRPVLVRPPRLLTRLNAVYSLLALIPSVEIVTDSDMRMPLATVQAKQIVEEPVPAPTETERRTLPTARTDITPSSGERPSIDKQIRGWIETAEGEFQRGAYESSIAAFSEWHRLAPDSPIPLRRIGDALSNLGYADEAVSFYRQSLDMDPGQIALASRLARLLMETGQKSEARNLLNAFTRLFPDDADVLLAQAEWLFRENRVEEAEQRVKRVLQIAPDHFEAALFQLRLADNETARTAAFERLLDIGKTPEEQYRLMTAIRQNDLMTYANSHLLVAAMQQIALENPDPRIQEYIRDLEPLTESVHEDFSKNQSLSPQWWIEGGIATVENQRLHVQAKPARNEFSVRLLRSERWRDCYIELSADQVKGALWLYARRSRHHLVRFGFDTAADRLHLQVWKGRNNDIIANQNIPWSFPKDGCVLRLEIRGKGISGLVNGKPVFDVPLQLPDDFGLGWTAFALQSADRGTALADLTALSSGPLPVRIAYTPPSPTSNDQGAQTMQLRALLPVLTDVSPEWFAVDAAGSWSSSVNEESDFFRMFTRYYRLRLTPTVRVQGNAPLVAADIITVCRTHGFDGLVLRFEAMPDNAWFATMDMELTLPGLDIIVIAPETPGGAMRIRGVASSRTLFPQYGAPQPLRQINPAEAGTADIGRDPVLYRF